MRKFVSYADAEGERGAEMTTLNGLAVRLSIVAMIDGHSVKMGEEMGRSTAGRTPPVSRGVAAEDLIIHGHRYRQIDPTLRGAVKAFVVTAEAAAWNLVEKAAEDVLASVLRAGLEKLGALPPAAPAPAMLEAHDEEIGAGPATA